VGPGEKGGGWGLSEVAKMTELEGRRKGGGVERYDSRL
jgi:hypothetical protein